MNEIKFTIRHNEFAKLIIPIIDGKSLISILKEFEKPFAKKEGHLELAGGYEGIPYNYVGSPKVYYAGLNQELKIDGKITLLDCHCLCVGCWSFVTQIETTNKHIVWKNFEQVHRNNWDYSNLEEFTFNKAQYEDALVELEKHN